MLFSEPSPENLLDLVKDWEDPYPAPLLETHDGFIVVRDDLLGAGSKIRFADFLISTHPKNEFVLGSSPRHGYGQISLSFLCKRYNKKCKIFIAKSKEYHACTQKAISFGADVTMIDPGYLAVTQKRAAEYTALNPANRVHMAMGLEDDTVLGSIIKVARNMPVNPKEIWTVASSGTLSRGLQMAFPNAEVHAVQVGHQMKPREYGRAIVHVSPYKFADKVKDSEAPPYPSVKEYDAKLWSWVKKYASPGALVWNVGA